MRTTILRAALVLAAPILATFSLTAGWAEAETKPTAKFEARPGELLRNQPPSPPDAPEGTNWWYYPVTLRERSGRSGITLTGWRKCYITPDEVGCEKIRGNFKQLYGSDRIPAGGTLRLKKPAWVWAEKTGGTYDVEATYWGRDDAGHEVKAGYRFSVTSD